MSLGLIVFLSVKIVHNFLAAKFFKKAKFLGQTLSAPLQAKISVLNQK